MRTRRPVWRLVTGPFESQHSEGAGRATGGSFSARNLGECVCAEGYQVGTDTNTRPVDRSIRFGIRIDSAIADARKTKSLIEASEEHGLDSFWVVDHPLPVTGYLAYLQQTQVEALTLCAWAAALTERVTIGTGALIAPLRHKEVLSNAWRTLQELSQGRARAGLVVGWNRLEYECLGVPFRERGKRCDAIAAALRAGEPSIPVLLGGGKVGQGHDNLGPEAWSATWLVRLRGADGWLVRPQCDAVALKEGLALIGRRTDGQDPFDVVHFNYGIIDRGERVDAVAGSVLGATNVALHRSEYWLDGPDATVERIVSMVRAGATEIVLHLLDKSVEEVRRWVELTEEVRTRC